MSSVGGNDIFGSGGHRWEWRSPRTHEKVLVTTGTIGGVGIPTATGPCAVRITGVLKAASNAAMKTLRQAIETLCAERTPSAYVDDQGNTGTGLVLERFIPGKRVVAADLTGTVWLYYTVDGSERTGGPYA